VVDQNVSDRAQPSPAEASTTHATRAAARLAALIAVPVAVVAGFIAFRILGTSGTPVAAPSAPQASTPVTMRAPSLPAQTATVCRALLAALPDALRDRARRPVTAGAEQNAAYGDPPITLACDAAPLPSVAPTDDVYVMSGVCWYAVPGTGSTAWTAIDRTVTVTVTIPNSYQSQGQWANEFSGAIVSAVPATTTVPFGCHG
jgi:Protein of unknown function (DUF3515)